MKKNYFFIFLLFCTVQTSFSQNNLACDGERYIDDVFSDFTVTTVTYGSNTTIFGANQDLEMDIYEPVGDVHEQRPVILFAFGGSFIFGNKSTMAYYCEQFAKKGYVAATIDYRLGFFGFGEEAVTGAVMRAVSDMKGAVRYFRQDAATDNLHKVHPDFILVGGYSAGAITATHVAYLDENDENIPQFTLDIISNNGGFEGNTGDAENLSYSSDVFAVYSLSGGLREKEWIDENETESLVSYHGTADGTVPYLNGLANNIAEIDGSGLLHTQANAIDLPNYLKSVDDGNHTTIHGPLLDPVYEDDLVDFEFNSHVFLQNQMCPDFQVTNTNEIASIQQTLDIYPNPSYDVMQFDFGKIESDYTVQVFDQLGRMVNHFEINNESTFSLEKGKIGTGMFFVNVLFEEEMIAPLTRKIVFN
ncbi:MAG: carboxylesterase family protein [Saprospiraceae bacterium]